MELILAITWTVKTTNVFIYNQIILIYTNIELKFRRDLFKLIANDIMESCLQK